MLKACPAAIHLHVSGLTVQLVLYGDDVVIIIRWYYTGGQLSTDLCGRCHGLILRGKERATSRVRQEALPPIHTIPCCIRQHMRANFENPCCPCGVLCV